MSNPEAGHEKTKSGPESLKKRIGIDLDDTLFWREAAIRYLGHFRNLLLRPSMPSETLQDIPHYDHSPKDIPAKLKERVSRVWHSRRTVIPGFAEMVRNEIGAGTEVYGITGRRASKAWFEMTDAQLLAANIKLTGIRMTPKGVSGLLSKADSIRSLGITEFYDDDKRTILCLANLFPEVRFNYIDHGLAPLSEKDLAAAPNINIIPIRQFCPAEKPKSEEDSAVRNSDLRRRTDVLNPLVELLHKKFPFLKARHVTWAGVAVSIKAIDIAEEQNRTGNYSLQTTSLAIATGVAGASIDLLDGKVARLIRSEMTDKKAKERDEIIGQAEDPFADGFIEAFQAGSSFYTAGLRGDRFSQAMALLRMATTNLPRTAKAMAGAHGFKVPETYSFKGIPHGDLRIFGVSLGRKFPNYLATLFNKVHGVPIQALTDVVATTGSSIVATERAWRLFSSGGEKALDDTEIKKAKFRAVVLGAESLALLAIAGYLWKRILPKK